MSRPDRPPPPPRLSPLSVGLQWATTITTIGFEMAVPTLAGWWLDGYFKMKQPVWTISLALLGIAVAMKHLWDLSRRLSRRDRAAAGTEPRNRGAGR